MKVYRATYKSVPNSTVRFSQWFADKAKADELANAARATGRPCTVRTVIVPTDDPAKMLRWLNNNALIYS